jgi:hypothetical protein
MAKEEKLEIAHTEVLTFRLRPAAIYLLKRLSAKHGGVGRAVQVATEILNRGGLSMNKKIKSTLQQQEETDNRPQELFSFSALPRTKGLIAHLSIRYYDETKNMVLRACIQLLYEMEMSEELLPGIPKDEMYDPDKP